uniref:Uncharacterized protein n=1 Tax=Rhizophora mucronata TaxID=61149 RepID=A0A2P2PUU5_RHIMU
MSTVPENCCKFGCFKSNKSNALVEGSSNYKSTKRTLKLYQSPLHNIFNA